MRFCRSVPFWLISGFVKFFKNDHYMNRPEMRCVLNEWEYLARHTTHLKCACFYRHHEEVAHVATIPYLKIRRYEKTRCFHLVP